MSSSRTPKLDRGPEAASDESTGGPSGSVLAKARKGVCSSRYRSAGVRKAQGNCRYASGEMRDGAGRCADVELRRYGGSMMLRARDGGRGRGVSEGCAGTMCKGQQPQPQPQPQQQPQKQQPQQQQPQQQQPQQQQAQQQQQQPQQ